MEEVLLESVLPWLIWLVLLWWYWSRLQGGANLSNWGYLVNPYWDYFMSCILVEMFWRGRPWGLGKLGSGGRELE
jgi:hypothetical protein